MVYCRNCGRELEKDAKLCVKCGYSEIQRTYSKIWYLVGFLIPLFGIIAGIVFKIQSRKGSWKLLVFSLVMGVINFILLLSTL